MRSPWNSHSELKRLNTRWSAIRHSPDKAAETARFVVGYRPMIRTRLKPIISLACFVLLLSATPVTANDNWINLTTKNFNIISNADEGGTRRLALKLEQFHFVFSKIFNLPLERSIKTTVMVFRNESSFHPYQPLNNGKPANVAGHGRLAGDEEVQNHQEHEKDASSPREATWPAAWSSWSRSGCPLVRHSERVIVARDGDEKQRKSTEVRQPSARH